MVKIDQLVLAGSMLRWFDRPWVSLWCSPAGPWGFLRRTTVLL